MKEYLMKPQGASRSKTFPEFDEYLTNLWQNKKSPQKHSLCKSLLKFLVSLYSNNETCAFGFRLIFHSLCASFRNDTVAYKVIVIITEMLGFEVKDDLGLAKLRYQIDNTSLNKSLNILNEILQESTNSRIPLKCELHNVTFSEFIKNMLKSIMALCETPNVYCYQMFLIVIKIDPLIIESLINEILVYIMLNDNSKCKKEYEEVMITILEVFSKLHRFQNLIAKMIPTLKSALEDRKPIKTVYTFKGNLNLEQAPFSYNIDDILPKSVLNYFTNCIVNLLNWQVINLFKTIVYHFKKAVEELSEVREDDTYMEILSSLTCWVLLSVRTAEHTVAVATLEKFVGCMEELGATLGTFGKTLLQKEHNHVLMRAFLNVCYYWAEIYMTLEYYAISKEVKMPKTLDNNFSSCNLSYLHSYLSGKEWCLISERINNFGEKPCKEIMQKLVIQKLKAFLIFQDSNVEDVTAPIIRTLSSDFDDSSIEILTDKFVVNNILDKMPSSVIITLAEVIVKELVGGNTKTINLPQIHDSQIVTDGILSVVFTKVNKLLKQKRKHDDAAPRKAFFSRVVSVLPPDMFLTDSIEESLRRASEIIVSESKDQHIDLKMNDTKIEAYLGVLRKLPVMFCTESSQKLLILLLLALHRDVVSSNCEVSLKKCCESLMISIVQLNKFALLDLFEATDFLELFSKDFDRSEDLFFYVAQNVFKSDADIAKFETGVTYIKDNLKESKCMKYGLIVLKLLSNTKKIQISADSKELCLKYKSSISHKMVKIVVKSDVEDRLVEPYAFVLKSFLAKDEDDALSKLRPRLPDYVDYCQRNISDANIKGCLLLFTTILHHKSLLSDLNEDFVSRIWNDLKSVNVEVEMFEEYSPLVVLIASMISNEQFSRIFEDLLKTIGRSIEQGDEKEFSKHLKTWTCILSIDLNPVKIKVLHEQLELLLEKLIVMVKCVEYKEELFEEVIQFEVSIIQANHVPLTATIMDFLMLTVSILMTRESHDFVHTFSASVSLMENLLNYRNPLVMDRLPPYLLQYRLLLKELCGRSKSDNNLQQNQVQKLADCGHKLEKLTKALVRCTKDMSRISMYLIADILRQYEISALDPSVKKHLNNCIYSLISLCDQHAVQYLMRVLSSASTEIFKMMYKYYKKYYRFTGKV
ncbi:uncharacterized protein [Tenebrio molitor]|uniref:uncharacterized protein isoform X2 n=1 Tax=Tenebrio molitor TaxID=7067 RepID=UPI0036247F58